MTQADFVITTDIGQRIPCSDAAEVVDMIMAFRLAERLKNCSITLTIIQIYCSTMEMKKQ